MYSEEKSPLYPALSMIDVILASDAGKSAKAEATHPPSEAHALVHETYSGATDQKALTSVPAPEALTEGGAAARAGPSAVAKNTPIDALPVKVQFSYPFTSMEVADPSTKVL